MATAPGAPPAPTENVQLSVANFKPGSFIIIENRKDQDLFFIVRQGKVKITSSVLAMTGQPEPLLAPGDFFGVIGAMTGHVRNETAVAAEPCSLIAVKKAQFGWLIQKNTPLAMKIIKSFSRDLRHLNNELAKRTTKGKGASIGEGAENLFANAEFYYNNDQPKTAAYLFHRYMELLPEGAKFAEAQEKLASIPGIDPEAEFAPKADFNRVYADGQMLFSEFEPGDELFIIQSGKVKITKIINNQELLIAVLGPGDIFGEMAILDNKPRAASAIAFGEARVMAVNRANFEKIVIQNATMATKLITLLSDRLWTIYHQLANLLFSDPVARLWDTLLTQLLKNHIPIEPKKNFHFSFGHNELLKMCGLEGAAADLAVRKLLSHRNVSVKNDKLYCDDIAEIKKEVDFALKMQQRESKLEAAKRPR